MEAKQLREPAKPSEVEEPDKEQQSSRSGPNGERQTRKLCISLTAEEVDGLKKGVNFINRGADRFHDKYIVWKAVEGPVADVLPSIGDAVVNPVLGEGSPDDEVNQHLCPVLRACRNVCRHQQGECRVHVFKKKPDHITITPVSSLRQAFSTGARPAMCPN